MKWGRYVNTASSGLNSNANGYTTTPSSDKTDGLLQLQFAKAGSTTTTFSTNDICKSIIIQMKKLMVDRFEDEVADTEYQLPFCPGDKISIFIRMKCNITLDNLVGSYTNTSEYEMLKNMFENRDDVNFNDVDSSMTLSEKVWRIKIKLI